MGGAPAHGKIKAMSLGMKASARPVAQPTRRPSYGRADAMRSNDLSKGQQHLRGTPAYEKIQSLERLDIIMVSVQSRRLGWAE